MHVLLNCNYHIHEAQKHQSVYACKGLSCSRQKLKGFFQKSSKICQRNTSQRHWNSWRFLHDPAVTASTCSQYRQPREEPQSTGRGQTWSSSSLDPMTLGKNWLLCFLAEWSNVAFNVLDLIYTYLLKKSWEQSTQSRRKHIRIAPWWMPFTAPPPVLVLATTSTPPVVMFATAWVVEVTALEEAGSASFSGISLERIIPSWTDLDLLIEGSEVVFRSFVYLRCHLVDKTLDALKIHANFEGKFGTLNYKDEVYSWRMKCSHSAILHWTHLTKL